MHLIPPERQNRRILESEKVCDAIAAMGDRDNVRLWADRFQLLGDPTRLAILTAIAEAGLISVTDLSVATDVHLATVSQALRLLRASGVVVAHRDGRIMRYQLRDATIRQLLQHVASPHTHRLRAAHH